MKENANVASKKIQYGVYIGTYTVNGSKGIYSYLLDDSTGKLKYKGVSSELENPSYLIANQKGNCLYAVSETDNFQGHYGGSAGAYSIDKKTGDLKFINSAPTEGKDPCHLAVDSLNRFLFIANYGDGSISIFKLGLDGKIGPVFARVKHEDPGQKEEMPHAHYILLSPDEKYLLAADLGLDKVMLHSFIREENVISATSNSFIGVTPGSGPRHMTFSPDGKFLYIINEQSSDIKVFKCSLPTLNFTEVQSISTLPDDYTGDNSCAAIRITKDGGFIYASNRGHDSIAIFSVDKSTGKLAHVSSCSTLGRQPRDFNIDPTGKYLFVANQNSGTIVPFSINQATGLLKPINDIIKVPSPSCIEFVTLG